MTAFIPDMFEHALERAPRGTERCWCIAVKA